MIDNDASHSQPPAASPWLVKTQDALQEMVDLLMQQHQIAVDTEANSLYAYRERVCLIQISIPGTDYLVDPLAIDDISRLGPVFSTANIEKVFHAADYDLSVLMRDFGFTCSNLFDTMWAGRILGWSKVGLGDILELYFQTSVNKRYQRYNWGKRPLDPKALTYAWMDSHYLLSLRQMQLKELKRTGRWEEAQEVFSYLIETVRVPLNLIETHFWRIKGINKLNRQEQKVLFKLYMWREKEAEKLNRPTMKVISNQRLIYLACSLPRNKGELTSAGLTNRQVQRFGPGILTALRGRELPQLPPHPNNKHHSSIVVKRYKSLRNWRRDVAVRRGVASDVILPNAVLWELAEDPPKTLGALGNVTGIGPWRCATYGPDIINLLT
jgi:ribonuclease D